MAFFALIVCACLIAYSANAHEQQQHNPPVRKAAATPVAAKQMDDGTVGKDLLKKASSNQPKISLECCQCLCTTAAKIGAGKKNHPSSGTTTDQHHRTKRGYCAGCSNYVYGYGAYCDSCLRMFGGFGDFGGSSSSMEK